ncbi:MAG: tyrosine-type recombinase/integrase [Anaerolineae bacterium]|jgi:integrase|nr:tyrosine-type recombinase/integrase [Anaerolineae bacterium]
MSSLNQTKSGSWRVQFGAGELPCGKRRELTIAENGVSKIVVEKIHGHIKTLLTATRANVPLDESTAVWLDGVGAKFRAKLVGLGIAPEDKRKKAPTLAELREDYFATKNFEDTTRDNCRYAFQALVDCLEGHTVIDTITKHDAECYLNYLKDNYSGSTVERRFRRASEFINFARNQGVEMDNPFKGFKLPNSANPANREYISEDDVEKMIAICKNSHWQLVLAVSRYLGLRMNSEIRFMRWEDVDWETQMFTIHDKKNKRDRIMPISESLMFHLKTHYHAQDGKEFFFPEKPFRIESANLCTQFHRYAEQAGVGPFKRPFQNMRSSRQTDLESIPGLPDRVACQYIGNNIATKNKHYGQTLDKHHDLVRAPSSGIGPVNVVGNNPIDESIRKMFAGEISPAESLAVYMNDPSIQEEFLQFMSSDAFIEVNMKATQAAMKKAASDLGLQLTPRIGLEPIT